MSFGYGIGDFLTVIGIAWKVYNDFKDAPEQLKDISQGVGTLATLLEQVDQSTKTYTLSQESKDAVARALNGCKGVLDELRELCEKHKLKNPALKRWWYRFRWDQVKINELRDRITVNATMLNVFQASYISSTATGIETTTDLIDIKTDRINARTTQMHRQIAQLTLLIIQRAANIQDPLLTVSTIGAAQRGNEPVWEDISRKLRSLGITPESIRGNKGLIIKTLRERQIQEGMQSGLTEDNEDLDIVFDLFDSQPHGQESSMMWFQDLMEVRPLFSGRDVTKKPVRVAILDRSFNSKELVAASNLPNIDWKQVKKSKSWFCSETTHSASSNSAFASLLLKIAPNAEIYVAHISDGTKTKVQYINDAIIYATAVWKVDIIVMPFGLPQTNETIRQAISYAYFKDIIMLAATATCSEDWRTSYPARSNKVIGISSSNGMGLRSRFNNFPPESGDSFMTLGENVEIPCLVSPKSGTSLAAIIAAGLVALILDFGSQNMGNEYARRKLFSNDGIRTLLRSKTQMSYEDYFLIPWKLLDPNQSAEHVWSSMMYALQY